MSETIQLEQIIFAGDDLVPISRSHGFPNPEAFQNLALKLVAPGHHKRDTCQIFSFFEGHPFLAQACRIERDSRGRQNGFLVHIFVIAQKEWEFSAHEILLALQREDHFFSPRQEDPQGVLDELGKGPLPVVEVEVTSIESGEKILSTSNLMEISGKIKRGQQVLLTGNTLEKARSVLWEISDQLDREGEVLEEDTPFGFALSLMRPSLAQEIPLSLIVTPQMMPKRAFEVFPEAEIYHWEKGKYVLQEAPSLPSPERPPSPLRGRIATFFLLSLVIVIVAYYEANWPSVTEPKKITPPLSEKRDGKDREKRDEKSSPPVPVVSSPKWDTLKRPEKKAFHQARKEIAHFRWPRHFYLFFYPSCLRDRESGFALPMWFESPKVFPLLLSPTVVIKKYQGYRGLHWDDFVVNLFKSRERNRVKEMEKRLKILLARAQDRLTIYLEKPTGSPRQVFVLSAYNLNFGFRSPHFRDRNFNVFRATLWSLALLAQKSQTGTENVYLWLLQKLRKSSEK